MSSRTEEDDESKTGKKAKSKKTAKKRELVFDEDLGQVVAVRKRKGSRTNPLKRTTNCE